VELSYLWIKQVAVTEGRSQMKKKDKRNNVLGYIIIAVVIVVAIIWTFILLRI